MAKVFKNSDGQVVTDNGNAIVAPESSAGAVRYDEPQTLTAEQKAQARQNIGAPSKDWEKLCDLTTTEAIGVVSWTHGDNGQVFNDYSKLFVQMILQPTTQDERRIRINPNGTSPWEGKITFYDDLSVPSSSNTAWYSQVYIEKTPAGAASIRIYSQDINSVTGVISKSSMQQTSALPGNTNWEPSVLDTPIGDATFNAIAIGGYGVHVIEPNCRFVIYGKK